MIKFGFQEHEERLLDIEVEFNELLNVYSSEVLEWGPYQLHKACPEVSVEEWKQFRLNVKVDQWYEDEMEIMMKAKIIKMLNMAGDSNSTAVAQTLGQALNYIERNKDKNVDPTVYIYTFINLSPEEEKAPNVRTVKNIPTGIKNAIKEI